MSNAYDYPIEPELTASSPRRVRFKPVVPIARAVFIAILLLSLLFFGGKALNDIGDLQRLAAQGKSAWGRVTDKRVQYGKSKTFYLSYVFEADGLPFYDEDEVNQPEMNAAQPGAPLSVTYLPTDPRVHRRGAVNGDRVAKREELWALGILAGLTFVGLFFAACEMNWRKQMRLARNGIAVVGEITDFKAPSPLARDKSYRIAYQFATSIGAFRTAKATVPPSVGERIASRTFATVLYNPARSNDNALYAALTAVEVEGASRF